MLAALARMRVASMDMPGKCRSCVGIEVIVTVHVAVWPSLSVTVSVMVDVPARSTKNVVEALVGDAGKDVEPAGLDVTVHW